MQSDLIVFYNANMFLRSGKHLSVDMEIVEGFGVHCIEVRPCTGIGVDVGWRGGGGGVGVRSRIRQAGDNTWGQ